MKITRFSIFLIKSRFLWFSANLRGGGKFGVAVGVKEFPFRIIKYTYWKAQKLKNIYWYLFVTLRLRASVLNDWLLRNARKLVLFTLFWTIFFSLKIWLYQSLGTIKSYFDTKNQRKLKRHSSGIFLANRYRDKCKSIVLPKFFGSVQKKYNLFDLGMLW